ncbi:hypothetical protein KP509_21G042100 [Ceratopteris richardii]|uniref:Uncharacterized protein n=1 Tax=Ceratopteris richardii TaxID=49495 RepID=A0A8T2SCN4_CERRI|nr:hypothetical protein KP509_21G042100 [Ceratopteris richardii]
MDNIHRRHDAGRHRISIITIRRQRRSDGSCVLSTFLCDIARGGHTGTRRRQMQLIYFHARQTWWHSSKSAARDDYDVRFRFIKTIWEGLYLLCGGRSWLTTTTLCVDSRWRSRAKQHKRLPMSSRCCKQQQVNALIFCMSYRCYKRRRPPLRCMYWFSLAAFLCCGL